MKCNVVFNEDDVLTTINIAIISGDALADGERDKIIQNPTNSDETNINQPEAEAEKADAPPGPEPTSSIPFPSESQPADKPEEVPVEEEDEPPHLGQGDYVQKKPPGVYR